MVNIVLIPYAALTCTVILLIILWLLSKAFFQIRNTSEDDCDRIENEHFGHSRMAAITKEKLVNAKLQDVNAGLKVQRLGAEKVGLKVQRS